MRKIIIFIVLVLILFGLWNWFKLSGSQFVHNLQSASIILPQSKEQVKVVSEESVTITTVKNVGPSVVTIAEQSIPYLKQQSFGFDPSGGIFNAPPDQQQLSKPQSIGSGFIVTSEGMIVTNKHVVSDTGGKYQVITADDKKYDVQKIYRDPANDIAIIKINPNQNAGKKLQPIEMGDSSRLQVGQFVIAIGTALGEFRNTVTTGVVSGVGRGITAGNEFAGSVEKLDNVIQTSAAINPGNSGGPLLNSLGKVIGINTAVAQAGQNIGFALPINTVKDSLNNFNQNGQFNRPYLGIAYKLITKDSAILHDIPQGAYMQQVASDSPAEKAGVQQGDIMTKVDGQQITEQTDLAKIISKKKVTDTITVTVWRDGKTQDMSVTLESTPNQ